MDSMNFQERYLQYRQSVDAVLARTAAGTQPASLYTPVNYILEAEGKRIRAALLMFAAEAVSSGVTPDMARNVMNDALTAGAAIEILHAFTLVHDDIMDSAATRRGIPTVHVRWDESTAILAGDVMIGLAQRMLLSTAPEVIHASLCAFTSGLIDVCEGQALDKEYETRNDVTLDDYLNMISKKTGRLAETAAEIGGWVGGGTPDQIRDLCTYARHLGLAFQIQDDLLDITADHAEFGKTIGGDVIEGKKTYLLVRALDVVKDGPDRALLDRLLANKGLPPENVPDMLDLYQRNGILDAARQDIVRQTASAEQALEGLPDSPGRQCLVWLSRMLMDRSK